MSSSSHQRLQEIIPNIKNQLMGYRGFYDGLKSYLNGLMLHIKEQLTWHREQLS